MVGTCYVVSGKGSDWMDGFFGIMECVANFVDLFYVALRCVPV